MENRISLKKNRIEPVYKDGHTQGVSKVTPKIDTMSINCAKSAVILKARQ